jgi:hypothetical protein
MLANTLAKDDWDILSALMERALSQEENFKASLGEHITFESLKNAFHTRTKTTGYYYGNDLLEEPVSYRNTTFEDIKGILDTGAQLPENLMEHIVNEGNFELAVTLQKNGYNFNVNYVNGYTTQNSLELLISNITEHPYLYANYDEKASIDTLLALGVSTINTDGTRDALDYALQNMTPDNYSKKISIAEKLIQSGFRVEESHLYFLREFNKNYPDSFEKVREKFAHYVEQ